MIMDKKRCTKCGIEKDKNNTSFIPIRMIIFVRCIEKTAEFIVSSPHSHKGESNETATYFAYTLVLYRRRFTRTEIYNCIIEERQD